jgi:hypothetical protein
VFRDEIKVGMNCALRPRPVDTPAEVQVLAASPRGGSWKIRHLAGDQAGLEEWVPSRMLLCPWTSLPRVLKDEGSDRYLAETAEVVDRVTADAVNLVLVDASGESSEVGILNRPYECVLTHAAATRLWNRAGLPGTVTQAGVGSYVDRHDRVHLPAAQGYRMARTFASSEPETVLRYIAEVEDNLEAEGMIPGERWHHEYLRKQSPAMALARSWAGHETEVQGLRRKIERLVGMVERAAVELERAGSTTAARRLRRELRGQ